MTTVLNSFNTLLEEFLQKMILTFPEETKITLYYTHFRTTKQFNSRIPVEYFMGQLSDKGYHILTRNECFFKRSEIVNYAESFTEKTGLVDRWETVPQDIKNNIWEYIQSMFILGMKSMNREQELKELVKQINNDSIII